MTYFRTTLLAAFSKPKCSHENLLCDQCNQPQRFGGYTADTKSVTHKFHYSGYRAALYFCLCLSPLVTSVAGYHYECHLGTMTFLFFFFLIDLLIYLKRYKSALIFCTFTYLIQLYYDRHHSYIIYIYYYCFSNLRGWLYSQLQYLRIVLYSQLHFLLVGWFYSVLTPFYWYCYWVCAEAKT